MSLSLQDEYIKKESLHGAQNYSPLSVVLARGEGAYLVKAHKRGINAFIKFLSLCRWPDATPQLDKKGKAYLGFKILDQTAYRGLRKIQRRRRTRD